MDFPKISEKLIPGNYLKLALEAQKSKEILIKELIEKVDDTFSRNHTKYNNLKIVFSENYPRKAGAMI